MELESGKWERFCPILAEEEWDHVMIGVLRNTYRIFRNFVKCHRTRSLSLILFVQYVMYTLDEKRVKLGDFLTTDP
jgi:hypothetical protein